MRTTISLLKALPLLFLFYVHIMFADEVAETKVSFSEIIQDAVDEDSFIKEHIQSAIAKKESPLRLLCHLWTTNKKACEKFALPNPLKAINDQNGIQNYDDITKLPEKDEVALMFGIYKNLLVATKDMPAKITERGSEKYLINPNIHFCNYVGHHYKSKETKAINKKFPYKNGGNLLNMMINEQPQMDSSELIPLDDKFYVYREGTSVRGEILQKLDGGYLAVGAFNERGRQIANSGSYNAVLWANSIISTRKIIAIVSDEKFINGNSIRENSYYIYKGIFTYQTAINATNTVHSFEELSQSAITKLMGTHYFLEGFEDYLRCKQGWGTYLTSIDINEWTMRKEMHNKISKLQPKADQGNPDAQYEIARAYYKAKEYDKAIEWAELSIKSGNPKGNNVLGSISHDRKDYRKALAFYELGAKAGYVRSQYNLANMYFYGEGCSQNENEAEYWYTKAANQGDGGAMNNLGNIFFREYNRLTKNQYDYKYNSNIRKKADKQLEKALALYEKAGIAKEPLGYRNLAKYYDYQYPRTEQEDVAKAAAYYLKAAQLGDTESMRLLAACYERGSPASAVSRFLGIENLKKNPAEAERWYIKAAENGDEKSIQILIDYYSNGIVFDRNLEKARYWKDKLK